METAQNYLLQNLPEELRGQLVSELEPIDLPLRFGVESTGAPVEYIYFPDAGMVSVVVDLGKSHQSEAGTVGNDLCTGHAVILGGDISTTTQYVQIPGRGNRIRASVFKAMMHQVPGMRPYFNAAVESFMAQATFTIVTNSRGKLEERLSRWLLMAHDRTEGDDICITHDLLSVMLGVRRPGVTTALQYLEDRRAVSTERAKITVKDRALLKSIAGPFYGPAEVAQTRLIGWQPKPIK
jgi:CRP-like cAMP-binding protein